jgi:hypothetical protein
LEVEGPGGRKSLVDPKTVRIVPEGTKAVLGKPGKPLEDPKARVDSYLLWAQQELGGAQ